MMSAFEEILEAVVGLAEATHPPVPIVTGALPPDESISMTYASGAPDATFLDKGMAYQCSIVCNGKAEDQQAIAAALSAIHIALTQAKNYPSAQEWQITDIDTISAPSYLDREQNGQYLYGSSLRVKFYFRNLRS